jgi:hypothetical protein
MRSVYSMMLLCGFAGFFGVNVRAGVAPTFTEDFNSSSSAWRDSAGTQDLAWVSSGGAGGGAFSSTTFNFASSGANATPVLFRGQDEFNSSGGAFVGDWVAGGVDGFSAFVRHDAPTALNFFARFAGPANFPGAASVFMIPVAPNTWTQLNLALPDAGMTFEGPFTYSQVFSNIGHVQIGVSAQGLAGLDQTIHFGLDQISIVPEPATLMLLGGGALVVLRRASGRRGQSR